MMTITRQEAINSLMMEYLAKRHILREKTHAMEKRFGCDLVEFEKRLKGKQENFSDWDAFIEWKSYRASLEDIDGKISELEHGEFALA